MNCTIRVIVSIGIMLAQLALAGASRADTVVEDEGVGFSYDELAFIVKYWTPDMQQAAANDPGDRIELINMALANKKIAMEAEKFSPDNEPELYWTNQLRIRNILRASVVTNYVARLEYPDMSALAEEAYHTEKDKYALVPESRKVSHLLLICRAGECVRDEKRAEIEAIKGELDAGASFEALVSQYSEDPGTKANGGKLDKILLRTTTDVDPYFLEGVFEIESEGDIELVESNFGFHLIRLDELNAQYHRPFEEVKGDIVAALEKEYRNLSSRQFDAKYRLTPDAVMNEAALEEIFAPYMTE